MPFNKSKKELFEKSLSHMTFQLDLLTSRDKTGEELQLFLQEVIDKGLNEIAKEGSDCPLESDIQIKFTESLTTNN